MAAEWQDQIGARLREPEKWPDDVARVEALVKIPLVGRGLDIGCSDGAVIARWLAASPNATCQALDIEERPEWEHYRDDVRLSFRASYCFPRNPFDWITATEVLEHQYPPRARALLENIARHLVPRGHVILTVPNRLCADPARERWSWPDHKSFYFQPIFQRLLQQYFREVRVQPIVDGIWLLAECRA